MSKSRRPDLAYHTCGFQTLISAVSLCFAALTIFLQGYSFNSDGWDSQGAFAKPVFWYASGSVVLIIVSCTMLWFGTFLGWCLCLLVDALQCGTTLYRAAANDHRYLVAVLPPVAAMILLLLPANRRFFQSGLPGGGA